MHKTSKETEPPAAIFHALRQHQQSCTKLFAFRFHDLISLHGTSSVPWLVAKVGGDFQEVSVYTKAPQSQTEYL